MRILDFLVKKLFSAFLYKSSFSSFKTFLKASQSFNISQITTLATLFTSLFLKAIPQKNKTDMYFLYSRQKLILDFQLVGQQLKT